jgi:hypothetical protein
MSLALAPTPIDPGEWAVLREQAQVLVGTGFLPAHIKTPEQAIAIMLKARELGIPPMYGLSNVTVIQGKPTCSAELMLALVYRDHGDRSMLIEQTDAGSCTITYRRRAWAQPSQYSFSMADAKTAGLLSNQTWQKYPAAMLRARCISAVARMAFPDSIAGMYTPEELGAAVTVGGDGEIEVETIPGARYGDGALDAPSPRGRAIAAQMDQAVAEADALLDEPPPRQPVMQPEDFFRDDEPTQHEQEQPPADDALAAKRTQALEWAHQCREAGIRTADPHPQATETALDDYVARHRRMLASRATRA